MATILCIETATTNCSVSIAVNGKCAVLQEENAANYKHSEQLHVFIEKAIKKAGLKLSDLDAIAVSKGPGSYTGLRIGVSAAKGLCFALNIPLISVNTLQSMAHQLTVSSTDIIIPVLDARRMEVYSAIFDSGFQQIRETKAEIIDKDSFGNYAHQSLVHFIGDGAQKCSEVLPNSRILSFIQNVFHPQRNYVLL